MKQITEQFFRATILALFIIAASVNIKAAVYMVTNTSDGNAGSLRAAVATANATIDDDTINFNIPANDPNCATGGVCTIKLISGEFVIDAISTAGKLTIINSTGTANLILDGNNTSRIFYVNDGAEATLNGVTVANGNGTGTTDTTFNGAGGGIENLGKLTLTNSVIRNNSATDFSGGIDNYLGTLILTNTSVSNNTAGNIVANGIGAGGGIYNYQEELNSGLTLSVTNSTISNNFAVNYGGILNTGNAILTNSTVSDNTVTGFAGGIVNVSTTPKATSIASMQIINSTVSNNTASSGGGIHNYNSALLAVKNSTISNNSVISYGGGILNTSHAVLINSTISGNTSMNAAGGIHNYNSAVLEVINSTISGNTANSGDGGGIFNDISTLTVTNSTITNNTATSGGGVNNWNNSATQLNIRNTIIAGNTATNGQPDVYHGSSDTFISNGNNLIGNTADTNVAIGWQISDILNQMPILSLLGNYGGTTQTHALLSGSPAINAGNNCVLTVNGCGDNNAALPTDQRGAARIGTVDIGAFEYAAPTAANVAIKGRVTTSSGRGLFNETVILTTVNGSIYYARTNGNGNYNFSNIESGETVILSVKSKRYQFPTQVRSLTGDEIIDFVALR